MIGYSLSVHWDDTGQGASGTVHAGTTLDPVLVQEISVMGESIGQLATYVCRHGVVY